MRSRRGVNVVLINCSVQGTRSTFCISIALRTIEIIATLVELGRQRKCAQSDSGAGGATLEMQKTVSAAEMVMPVHLVNVERPSLSGGLEPSETPQSKKQKKSGSTTKEVTPFYLDSTNPPESARLVQTDSNEDTWN
uniref:Uncharacterized protein n=1 Tax=Solanum lycopersicum TaxID=4081 RepID=A0A3Q7IZD9_SOLLC